MKSTNRLSTIFIIVASSLLLIMLLAFGARWRLERRSHEVADQVVAEVRERAAAGERVVRPSHVEAPVPGTLAETLGPLMPELIAFHDSEPKLPAEVEEACINVREGARSLWELPRECREALDRGRPLMQRALRASRTELGGLPEGMRLFDDPQHPYQRTLGLPLMRILKLAALETRIQTDRGQTDAALETCLDGLSLARELSYGNALIGAMGSATSHDILFFACGEAIDRVSPGGWRRAEVALRRIRPSMPPLSTTLRDERAYMPLYLAGQLFDRSQLDALPAGARAQAHQMSSQNLAAMELPSFVAREVMLHGWPIVYERIGRAIEVSDLPPDQRALRLAEQDRAFMSTWNPYLRENTTDYEFFAKRLDKERVQLDLLLALALVKQQHEASGTWPSEPPTLYPGQEVLLPTAMTFQRGEGGELFIHSELLKELSVMATP